MRKRVLVIGGTGFIGKRLVAALADRLEIEQLSVAHANPLREASPSRAVYHRVDDARLAELMHEHDVIVILTRPESGVINHIAATLRKLPPRRVVYASTALLYRGGKESQKEDAPLEATTDYERAKKAEEKSLRDAAHQSGSELMIARLSNVYGDVDSSGVVSRALHATMRGEAFPVYGNGEAIRDFIHVEDVAESLAFLLAKKGALPQVINVSSGEGISVADLLRAVEKTTNTVLSRVPMAKRKETTSVVADNTLLVKLVGAPKHDFTSGLEKTYKRFCLWYDKEKRREKRI